MSDELSRAEQILEHHGVKGQKWGVRRRSKKGSSGPNSHDLGNPRHLSDDDLKKLVARLQLEKQFKDLTAKPPTRGEKFRQGLLEDAGRTLFKIALNATVGKTLKDALEGTSSSKAAKATTKAATASIPKLSAAAKSPANIGKIAVKTGSSFT